MSQMRRSPQRHPAAFAGLFFAGALLCVLGVLGILEGIAAIARNNVYAVVGDYAYKFDLTAWGWIQLVLGVIMLAAGIGVLGGATWARFVGITLTSVSVIAHFLFIPYQPLWSIASIGIGVFIIWSLCTVGLERNEGL